MGHILVSDMPKRKLGLIIYCHVYVVWHFKANPENFDIFSSHDRITIQPMQKLAEHWLLRRYGYHYIRSLEWFTDSSTISCRLIFVRSTSFCVQQFPLRNTKHSRPFLIPCTGIMPSKSQNVSKSTIFFILLTFQPAVCHYNAYKRMLCSVQSAELRKDRRMKSTAVGYDGVATNKPIDRTGGFDPVALCYVTTLRKLFARFCCSASVRKQYYCRWKKETATAGHGWGVVYRPQQWSSLLAEDYKTETWM